MLKPHIYVTTAVLMLVFDYLWLVINKKTYGKLVQGIQGTPLKVRLVPAILAYILMYIGMVLLVIPAIKSSNDNSITNVVRVAGTFGLCVYGIFNTTNMAILQNYSVKVAIIDTLWGTFLYITIAFIATRW